MAAIAWALAQTLAQIESKADRVARVETGIEIVADLTVRIYDVYVDPVAESRTNPALPTAGRVRFWRPRETCGTARRRIQ